MFYVILLFVLCFFINIPMGAWRVRHEKFSLQWFIAIHAPVPLIFLLRLWLEVSYFVIPLLILGSVLGQIAGGTAFRAKNSTSVRL